MKTRFHRSLYNVVISFRQTTFCNSWLLFFLTAFFLLFFMSLLFSSSSLWWFFSLSDSASCLMFDDVAKYCAIASGAVDCTVASSAKGCAIADSWRSGKVAFTAGHSLSILEGFRSRLGFSRRLFSHLLLDKWQVASSSVNKPVGDLVLKGEIVSPGVSMSAITEYQILTHLESGSAYKLLLFILCRIRMRQMVIKPRP